MQQLTAISILSAPLDAIDRRSLSQAWYDALRRGATARAQVPVTARRGVVTSAAGVVRASAARPPGAPPAAKPATAAKGRTRSRRGDGGATPQPPGRRARIGPLGRRIVAAVRRSPRDGTPRTVALRTADGRVCILVRDEGVRLRLVALCAPALRERVARALAEARLALAGAPR